MSFLEAVKKLRDKTSAGMMECKQALKAASGDVEKAIEFLRKNGIAKAEKKASRTAGQGLVESYIHTGGRIGVLLEINCETDFVARGDDFKGLVKDVCMQIAAANPMYVSRDEVPQISIDKEKEIYRSQMKDKPEAVIEKILDGKLAKYYSEVCLLEQPYIKDPNLKVKDLVTAVVAKLGENIVVKRFARFALGEEF